MTGKYRPYPDYKDSGVEWLGAVPESWSIRNSKRVYANRKEHSTIDDEQLSVSQKYGVIPQMEMMRLNDSKVMLALSGTDSFRKVKQNDFVISLRSFEGGIEHSPYDGCVSPAYTVLHQRVKVKHNYFKFLFKSMPFIAALQASTNSLRDGKSINYEQFSSLSLCLPSLQEQTQIANFLDHETAKIDTLIAKQEKLIELLQEKRQAVISHAVTKGLDPDVPMKDSGVAWLGAVPAHWKTCLLKHHSMIIDCKHITATFFDKGFPLASIGEVKGWNVSLESAKRTSEYYYLQLIEGGRKPRAGDMTWSSKNGHFC